MRHACRKVAEGELQELAALSSRERSRTSEIMGSYVHGEQKSMVQTSPAVDQPFLYVRIYDTIAGVIFTKK